MHIPFFEDVEEADLASELITELKKHPDIPFASPVFYSKNSGLRIILMNNEKKALICVFSDRTIYVL